MRLHPDVERLALLGWQLHPVSAFSRAACFKGALAASTCDLGQLERWTRAYPACGWRVRMAGSGIWALDVDRPGQDHGSDGFAALTALIAANAPLPDRPTTISGGGGCALFFRDAGHPICGKTGWPEPGLDPRRGNLSVTVPPSRHHRTGIAYRWKVAPWDLAPPVAPDWLLRAVAPPPEPPMPVRPLLYQEPGNDRGRRYALAALRRGIEAVATARPGTRNAVLNVETFGLSRFIPNHLSASELADEMAVAARRAGLSMRETVLTIASGLRAGGVR